MGPYIRVRNFKYIATSPSSPLGSLEISIDADANYSFVEEMHTDNLFLQKAIDSYLNPTCNCDCANKSNADEEAINLEIDKVIFNDPATIILWDSYHNETKIENGKEVTFPVQDKTVVKCTPGEHFNKYNGFCAAVTKRIFETNSVIHKIIENAQDDSTKSKLKDIDKAMKVVEKKEKEKKMKKESKKNG